MINWQAEINYTFSFDTLVVNFVFDFDSLNIELKIVSNFTFLFYFKFFIGQLGNLFYRFI